MYDFLDAHKTISAFVKEKKFRSPTVTTIQSGKQTKHIKEFLASQGVIVGDGYGKCKDEQLRIANFPAITLEDIKKLLSLLK